MYRVAEHIYKADSYDQDPPAAIMSLYDSPMRAKFKEVLQQLMWEYTLKDEDTEEQIKTFSD